MTPLTKLLQKDADFVWNTTHKEAFQEIKQQLSHKPLLAVYQYNAETEVHTDACKDGLGATHLQRQRRLRPVMYYSQRTTEAESKYHAYELETLAIV